MNNTTKQAKRQYALDLQDTAGEILGSSWPVSSCLKRAVSGAGVEVRYNGESAHYHGVQTCQSPWNCPICARRIMAARKTEIETILSKAAGRGWRSLFLTVTLSHHTASRLAELLDGLLMSWRFIFSGDRTGERRALARVMAQIKTVEVRFGRNGWHPHLHVLLLVDEAGMSELEAGLFEDELAEVIFSRYARKAHKLGMRAEREAYKCQPVTLAGAAAHYVTKLEAALEMTEGQSKDSAALARSYSAFQLLAIYKRGERQVYGNDIAELYREYASATRKRRQVSYSREIRELGVDVKEDEQLIEEPKDERVLAVISLPLWRVICASKLRGALLDIADSGDEARVNEWLEWLAVSSRITTIGSEVVYGRV